MNIENSIGIIPARIGSSRLSKKLLRSLNGKPILKWVFDGSASSRLLRRLVVATDSDEIASLCLKSGVEFVLTPSDLPSGTDRVYFAYNLLKDDADFIINIQGDEPFITGDLIDEIIHQLASSQSDVSTLIAKINDETEIYDSSVVKVVMDKSNNALYFSRSPIPYLRDTADTDWKKHHIFYKHIGIYAFRSKILEKFTRLEQSKLEKAEKLEQLRLLENGYKILCIETNKILIGIDTEEDLLKAQNYLADSLSF